ncbi:MAG: hypothetical protein AAF568_06345, partial [Pseudomonadota bacterium]
QAGIGGVVAGALVYAFLRDNVATIENLRARGERLQISQQQVSKTLVDLQAQEKAALARGAELERQNQAQEARQAALQDEAEELIKRRDLLEAQANEQLQRQAELQADNERLLEAIAALERQLEELTEIAAVEPEDRAKVAALEAETDALTSAATERTNEYARLANSYFAVIASVYEGDDVGYSLGVLERMFPSYDLHVYRTTDAKGRALYAITLGGYLSAAEAERLVEIAQAGGRPGAYRWQSVRWGEDVSEEF